MIICQDKIAADLESRRSSDQASANYKSFKATRRKHPLGLPNEEFSCAAESEARSSPTDPLRPLNAARTHLRRQLKRHVRTR
jgi:hypothetical protein